MVFEDGTNRAVAALSRGGPATGPGRSTRSQVPEPRRAVVVTLDEATLPTGLVELRTGVSAVVRSGADVLLVDVSGLGRMSSCTVTALLWAQRRCRVQGSAVVLQGVTRRRLRMLRRTGLTTAFELRPARAAGSGGSGRTRQGREA